MDGKNNNRQRERSEIVTRKLNDFEMIVCVCVCVVRYCHIAPHSADDRRTFFFSYYLEENVRARANSPNEVDERKKNH